MTEHLSDWTELAILAAWVNDQCPSPGRLGHALRITRSLWLSSSMETIKIQLREECWSTNATVDAGTISAAHLVQPQCEKCISLFQPAVFPHTAALECSWCDLKLKKNLAAEVLYLLHSGFPYFRCFLLAALTLCSLAEMKEKIHEVFLPAGTFMYPTHCTHAQASGSCLPSISYTENLTVPTNFLNNITEEHYFPNYEEIKITRE